MSVYKMVRIGLLAVIAIIPLSLEAAEKQAPAGEEEKTDAQQSAAPSETEEGTGEIESESKEPDGQFEQFSRRLETTENALADQKKENDALKKQVETLSTRLEMVESSDEEDFGAMEDSFERTLDIYGFMDVELFYFDVTNNDAANGLFPANLSFMLNRLNLYVSSHMTETLSAMIELRFTFLPHGAEQSYDMAGAGIAYERMNTTVLDPLTSEEVTLGGLGIIRAHMIWQPFEYFGLIVGRYITPFGIWNLEHGSTVIIPVRPPYMLIRNVIPRAQTGAQVFGRVFPATGFYFDYAVTVSNGRGPTETIYDLDNNKALGFRLQGKYESNNLALSVGGFLYWGETTDLVKTIDNLQPVHFVVEQTENYTEITGALDLLVELFDFRLQGEYIRGSIKYDVRPLKIYPVIRMESPLGEYQPDFDKWCAYGLVAYVFNFDTNHGMLSLTPFFMYEYNVFDETSKESITSALSGGLNFRPSPFVALKYELSYISFPESDYIDDGIWMHSGQVAISF